MTRIIVQIDRGLGPGIEEALIIWSPQGLNISFGRYERRTQLWIHAHRDYLSFDEYPEMASVHDGVAWNTPDLYALVKALEDGGAEQFGFKLLDLGLGPQASGDRAMRSYHLRWWRRLQRGCVKLSRP